MLNAKRILLIVTGGIAAYKTPDLVRQLTKAGADVRCVLSSAGAEFVTPLTLQSLSGNTVYTDLFSLTDENEMGHIELSRQADVILVAPATANTLAKMAHGLADDLPSTVLLASNKPVLVVPAMNVEMWDNAATQDNIKTLQERGVTLIGPNEGELACGEWGQGRMSDVDDIVNAVIHHFNMTAPLKGKHAIVTSGPTFEPIDPVRYIANRSSGKQGHAIARALRSLGCRVTLVSGPVALAEPKGVDVISVQSGEDMYQAVKAAGPADIAVCAAAVADWRVQETASQKLKKQSGQTTSTLNLVQNTDILQALSQAGPDRPTLVVGFAAETQNVVDNARKKLASKGCDWILANDVSAGTNTFGGDHNTIHLVTRSGVEDWKPQSKTDVAEQLAKQVVDFFSSRTTNTQDMGA
ncbi:MAG: bifunctional phosphopantothenoylcysteine decarboxylase/phosphopantothenate--cysteine ligase CoaBC [Rhodospirillaceae bacterium]|nr:MAG: bifunctional phosphopantothenoylcysteine decarboxylase/phosphopantothenate--cysteine ligase CoaBC [Rhodospirillaceae bacterium]